MQIHVEPAQGKFLELVQKSPTTEGTNLENYKLC